MESAFKVKADGWLVKKIIALVWKWARTSLPRRGWVGMGGVRVAEEGGAISREHDGK